MSQRVRVLAGVLHVGEPALERAVASAETQHGADVSIEVIGNLPKWEAHRRLYRRFSEDRGAHDLLVKLDADMELVEPRLFWSVGLLLRRHRRLDHVVLGVDDWLSGERIMGISLWRSGVQWEAEPPDLFTDLNRSDARERFKLIDAGRPLVTHAVKPGVEQALRYGAHRALKAARTRKASRLARVEEFARFVQQHPEPERRLALAAVELAFSDEGAGRRLVDGELELRATEIERLQRRSEHLDAVYDAVVHHIRQLEESRPEDLSEAASGRRTMAKRLIRRAWASTRRRWGPRPLDSTRLTDEFLRSLNPYV